MDIFWQYLLDTYKNLLDTYNTQKFFNYMNGVYAHTEEIYSYINSEHLKKQDKCCF